MKYKLTDRALRRIILQEIKKLAEIGDLGGDIPDPTPEELAAMEAEETEEAELNSPPEARSEGAGDIAIPAEKLQRAKSLIQDLEDLFQIEF